MEKWLLQVENMMLGSVRAVIHEGVKEYVKVPVFQDSDITQKKPIFFKLTL